MRVGIIQSCYIPWRGYFDFINSVDLFVLFDDIPYPQGRSWRNRNQIKTKAGLKWLTVPINKQTSHLNIDQVTISDHQGNWLSSQRGILHDALSPAPYYRYAINLWEEGVSGHHLYLSELNIKMIQSICRYLGISTPIVRSSDYPVTGKKTERLINLLNRLGANIYLSGPSAKGYIEEDQFYQNGIQLEYKSYSYAPYPQLWGEYVGEVTILDLIANKGIEARSLIASQTPNEIVVACHN